MLDFRRAFKLEMSEFCMPERCIKMFLTHSGF